MASEGRKSEIINGGIPSMVFICGRGRSNRS